MLFLEKDLEPEFPMIALDNEMNHLFKVVHGIAP
jgi:hypothetical protein